MRHAPKASWWLIGTISTLATYIPPAAAKWFNLADPKPVETFLVISPLAALLICIIVVPFRESFRMYQEKELELQKERNDRAEEQRRWAEERVATEERLAGRCLDAVRRRLAEENLAKVSPAEEAALRQILVRGQVSESQLSEPLGVQGVIDARLDKLAQRTNFIVRNFIGEWSVNPSFKDILQELLGDHKPGP
jgi:hypothetical protein